MNEINGEKRLCKRIKTPAALPFVVLAATVLAACLLMPVSHAAPSRGDGTWTDTFDSNGAASGVRELLNAKVAGGSLKISEADPVDLGIAVPGESGVYAVLSTGLGQSGANIYCGTGDRGHLVEHDPTQHFEEAYQGPSHYGVSNSRGQAVPPASVTSPSRVMALASDGTLVYGGTYPDGHLFSFDPTYDGPGDQVLHYACEDLGAAPGGGSILALAYNGTDIYGGTSEGHLFSYNGSAFSDLGTPAGGGAINALAVSGATVYGGTSTGNLFSYNGSFNPLGAPAGGGAINALKASGATVYGGTSAGYVFSYNGSFSDLGQPSGAGEPVNAVAISGTNVYSGSENGHVYIYNTAGPGVHSDLGAPANCDGLPVNALTVNASGRIYGGTGSDSEGSEGHLFCVGGYEDHGSLPAGSITDVNYTAGLVYFVDSSNNLYTYPEPGTYTNLGSPDNGTVTNSMGSSSGRTFFGMQNGKVSVHASGDFTDLGYPSPGDIDPVNVVLPVEGALGSSRTTVFTGLSDGRLYSGSVYPTQPLTCTFTPLGMVGGSVLDLAWVTPTPFNYPSELYIGSSDGHLYMCYYDGEGNTVSDLGSPDGSAVNGLAIYNGDVFMALESGDLYSYDPDTTTFTPRGDAGSPLRAISQGENGVIAGSVSRHLWMYDPAVENGTLMDLGAAPDSGAVLSLCRVNDHVWGGTSGGGLFCHDSSYLADRKEQVREQNSIWCMTYDPNKQLFYAGTYKSAHFLVIDPSTGNVVDRGRPVDGERELEDILVASDGTVYGATYAGTGEYYNPGGGHLFTFDSTDRDFTDLGQPPNGGQWWVTSLVEGPAPDRLVYGANSWCLGDPTEGNIFSYNPSDGTWDDLGNPMGGTSFIYEGTRSLVYYGGHLYGATWNASDWTKGHVYSFDLGSGTPAVLGEPPAVGGTSLMYANALTELGGDIYGAQENGYAFRFNADPDPGNYDPESLGKPAQDGLAAIQVSGAPDDTIMFGTRGNALGSPGHVVNYDPGSGFRDIAAPVPDYQDRVTSLASASDSNVIVGGTYGKVVDNQLLPARLFMINPYKASTEYSKALSTGVFPAVEELGVALAGHESVGALCADPGGEKVLWGGTANNTADPGAQDAHLFTYETMTDVFTDEGVAVLGHKKVLSMCRTPDGYIYGGTGNASDGNDARLFSVNLKEGDPDYGKVDDLGVPLPGAKGIYSLTAGSNGRIYIGTGDKGYPDSGEPGHLVEYNPGVGFTDLGTIKTLGHARVTALLTGSNGLIYGGTGEYPGGTQTSTFFWYDPSTEKITPKNYPFENERSIHSMAELGGKIYCGTGPAGKFFSYDIAGNSFQSAAALPYESGSPVYSMVTADGKVYGCAGGPGMLFSFDGAGGLVDMGPLTYLNQGVTAAAVDNLGKPCFGTSGDTKLVRVDPDVQFDWGSVSYVRSPEPPVPGGREAYIDVMDSNVSSIDETPLLENAASGASLSPAADGQAGLHLRGRMKTSLESQTPLINDWSVTWHCLPHIDIIEPGKEYPGEDIWIWGSHFGDTEGTVTIDGYNADVSTDGWNNNCINVTIPADAVVGDVVVTTDGLDSCTGNFDLYTQPLIGSLSKYSAYAGETIEIAGTCLLDEQYDSFVSFNGVQPDPGDYLSWSDTTITVRVPADANSGNLTVTVRGEQSNAVQFTLLEDPVITGVAPAEACVGETVTIEGSFFLDERGGSTVKFGGVVVNDYVSWSNDSIEAKVPEGAQPGDITVTVNGRVSNGYGFTVLDDLNVNIENPDEGAGVSGSVDINASAAGGSGVSRVDFILDGTKVGSDNGAPYSYSWDTTVSANGGHEITCKAYDDSGRTAEDSVTVQVENNVQKPAKHWYFAEGCTDYGFETWILIANPSNEGTGAAVIFMDDSGKKTERHFQLAPNSRTTINAEAEAGRGNFLTEVTTDQAVVCERSMFWDNRTEGHASIGTTSLSSQWYFAEGCSDYGFDTYILVGNPGDSAANVTVDYMFENGDVRSSQHIIGPNTRKTINAREEVGAAEFSVLVKSGEQGIVAERAIYYGGRRCGTGTIGCPSPSNTWYLSEGSTDWGFETWLLIQCPGDQDATVDVTYQKSKGENIQKRYTVTGKSRFTVDLSREVGVADVSTKVVSNQPVVCERSMYWNNRSAGHCTIGSAVLGTQWFLAEGCTDYGFETWILLNNPNPLNMKATITFLGDDGNTKPVTIWLRPNARISVNAADYVPGSSFSTKVQAPNPIMVERAMYWNGRKGGTGSIVAK